VLLSQAWPISIVFNVFLSVKFLGEKFIWKYDLSALVLILSGCAIAINLSNKSTLVIDKATAYWIMFSLSSIVTILIIAVIIVVTVLTYKR
jgi:hypothetical protein